MCQEKNPERITYGLVLLRRQLLSIRSGGEPGREQVLRKLEIPGGGVYRFLCIGVQIVVAYRMFSIITF